ncbi:MAG TPA: hypothetical protein VJI12_01425 [archaeon]|nr:hypothetical protein [archaeon]
MPVQNFVADQFGEVAIGGGLFSFDVQGCHAALEKARNGEGLSAHDIGILRHGYGEMKKLAGCPSYEQIGMPHASLLRRVEDYLNSADIVRV